MGTFLAARYRFGLWTGEGCVCTVLACDVTGKGGMRLQIWRVDIGMSKRIHNRRVQVSTACVSPGTKRAMGSAVTVLIVRNKAHY